MFRTHRQEQWQEALIFQMKILIYKGFKHVLSILQDNPGPGHLEPLGSQRPTEGKIDTLDDFPDPQEFYDKYILPGKPVLIKNGARHIPAFTLWNDAYLRRVYNVKYSSHYWPNAHFQ